MTQYLHEAIPGNTLAQHIGEYAKDAIERGPGAKFYFGKDVFVTFKDKLSVPVEQYVIEALPEVDFFVSPDAGGLWFAFFGLKGEPVFKGYKYGYSKTKGFYEFEPEETEEIEREDEYTVTLTATELEIIRKALYYHADDKSLTNAQVEAARDIILQLQELQAD